MALYCPKPILYTIWASSWTHNSCLRGRWQLWLREPSYNFILYTIPRSRSSIHSDSPLKSYMGWEWVIGETPSAQLHLPVSPDLVERARCGFHLGSYIWEALGSGLSWLWCPHCKVSSPPPPHEAKDTKELEN